MPFHYSLPFERLLDGRPAEEPHIASARIVIVGSGYGGSVAAYRLADPDFTPTPQRPHDVMVLERGKEYALGEFPNDLADMPAHVRLRQSGRIDAGEHEDALFDIRQGDGVDALVGSGLGGTSLINANVAIQPPLAKFAGAAWPKAIRDPTGASAMQAAFRAVSTWLGVANENDKELLKALPKYQALSRYASALGASIEPAPITVTLREKQNTAGITQAACTNCGNCITGCNVGAKNTLAMNLIPAAVARGAKFFTGAIVYSVQPIAATATRARHWRIYVRPVSQASRARFYERYYIEADTVVLGAGTFGSTEILKRSEELQYIRCSAQLGMHFSTNGDGISMSFAQARPVVSLGSADYLHPASNCGPTITALVRGQSDRNDIKDRFLLEDGAIPAPLIEIIGEVAATAAQFGRLGYSRLPGWFAHAGIGRDPLASHRDALDHSQVFLIMSDDGARGRLCWRGEASAMDPEAGGVIPVWNGECEPAAPDGARNAKDDPGTAQQDTSASLERIDSWLATHDRSKGLDAGQYIHNPLWKLLPDSATAVMSGKFPGGRLLTVHPLGGCRMADGIEEGVVNDAGQVFNAANGGLHDGLYVMDGSIVPEALGENPFLTIAALAWRACDSLSSNHRQGIAKQPFPRWLRPPAPRSPDDADIIVREQMVGELPASVPAQMRETLRQAFPSSARWFENDRLVLRIETEPRSTDAALRGGPVNIVCRLYESPISGAQASRWHTYGIDSKSLEKATLIASGTGTMTIVEPVPPRNKAELLARRKSALQAYRSRRGMTIGYKLFMPFAPLLGEIADEPPGGGLLGKARGFLGIAEMQCTFRRFAYKIALTSTSQSGARSIRIEGEKILAWNEDTPRLWAAFTGLDARIAINSLGFAATARLYVDMAYVMGDGLLTAASGQNTPHAIFNCIAYSMRLARAVVQSTFWEFGAPEYPSQPLKSSPQLPPKIAGVRCQTYDLPVVDRINHAPATILTLKLHRYNGGSNGAVLLLHGLAQGSLIYAHEKLPTSMASYFAGKGYDVWLLDYRLSNQFGDRQRDPAGGIDYEGWAMEEIGTIDVPAAVAFVHHSQDDPARKIHVFAHCVGAVGISMAILADASVAPRLASVALNAIHPWVMPSPYNKVRAKLGVVFRDLIDNDDLDPIVQRKDAVTAAQSIIDRLAFSMARLDEESSDRHSLSDKNSANTICDRMTFMYGHMWRHENIVSIHPYWKDLVGRAPGMVYRHLHYLLMSERLVDREGRDIYLTADNLRRWAGIRTLFMHGEDSMVFNPQSATRSAIRLTQAMRDLDRSDNQAGTRSLPSTPIRLRRVPGYGHMDVIFAADAANRSFRYVDHFFQGHFDTGDSFVTAKGETLRMDSVDAADDPCANDTLQPQCGPIIRSALADASTFNVRCWVEMPTNCSVAPKVSDFLPPGFSRYSELPPSPGMPDTYRWVDVEYPSASPPGSAYTWPGRLQRLAANQLQDCHFIVASCSYPGTPFDRDLPDTIFTGIDGLLRSGESCDLLFLIGDQIYCDASGGLFDPISWRDRYTVRYMDTFNGAAKRKVLGSIPTHFALDDHEIANDYCGPVPDPPAPLKRNVSVNVTRSRKIGTGDIVKEHLEFARLAAASYMGAGRERRRFGTSTARAGAFSYALDDQAEISCPAFIMDTRSERSRAQAGATHASMLLPAQWHDLQAWLSRLANDPRPKFIFSGSVIAPLSRCYDSGAWLREDGFAGYPRQLQAIVDLIVERQIQRVVFVGGDLHLSCAARLTLQKPGKRPVSAVQIVASGLYAPFTFANTSAQDILWRVASSIQLPGCSIMYLPELLTDAANFVKVSATPLDESAWQLDATAYGSNGAALTSWSVRF